jgi:hypothetical protein
MAARIVIGGIGGSAPRWYLSDTGKPWAGDYETALKIRYHLARQGLGVLTIETDTPEERLAAPAPNPWAGVTDTDCAVN